MICTSQTQATAVAVAGANKIEGAQVGQYEVENSGWAALYGKSFTVKNHATGAAYSVSIEPGKTFCTCPFYRANRAFGTCKHIVHCAAFAAWQAGYDKQADDFRDEAAVVGPAPVAPACTACPVCGTAPLWSDTPDATCAACEDRALSFC